jgi:two-component system, OmpR family, sensor kinase
MKFSPTCHLAQSPAESPCYAHVKWRIRPGDSRVRRIHSIRARLSLVFLFLLLLVVVLGMESLRSLSSVNEVSAQIRDRWLPSTRALGDLNNYTSDVPPAEEALLRADSATESSALARQIVDRDLRIEAAESAYQRIRHDRTDEQLFRQFQLEWAAYRALAPHGKSPAFGKIAAVKPQPGEGASKEYDRASKTLSLLTERNVASALEASARASLEYRQARTRIVSAILLAAALVASAMLHVTRSISAPLVDLAARMHRLAASETNIEVLGSERRDEIGEMVRAVTVFRDNAIDLAQNRHALAQQASMLTEKLAEEQRLTQLQRNFLSMVSHEFRTPLAIIDGHAQRLITMRNRLTPDELAERAQKVRGAVRRVTLLIDNLIGSARFVDGPISLWYHPSRVDLAALVRDVCQVQRELTSAAQILVRLPDEEVFVHGDATLLHQVVGNLLSNAVKYSRDGGLIEITLSEENARVRVSVKDCGIGIPTQERGRVFERYYRGSNTSGIVGSGVGLYLVKAIVELHEGEVELQSREGRGSTFTVHLPLRSLKGRERARSRSVEVRHHEIAI